MAGKKERKWKQSEGAPRNKGKKENRRPGARARSVIKRLWSADPKRKKEGKGGRERHLNKLVRECAFPRSKAVVKKRPLSKNFIIEL